jgi:hypothetical protein
MKATVVEIQSRQYKIGVKPQPYRRIALQFDFGLARGGTEILRVPEPELGIIGLKLDDEVEVSFTFTRAESVEVI